VMFIEPVTEYAHRMNVTFLSDHHYQTSGLSENQILDLSRHAFRQFKWSKLGNPLQGHLSFAYVLPKDKDPVNKSRPIIPSIKHPLRRILNIAARAWCFVLVNLKFSHFNILAVKELKEFTIRTCTWAEADCNLIGVSFDIKNMYTELRHCDILNALWWLLQESRKQFKYQSVIVQKKGRQGVCFGKNSDTSVFVTVKIKKLFNLAKFELENMFFKVGCDVIMKQTVGLAMGGFQSPSLAMILAAVSEHRWLTSLGSDSHFIRGARYIDDALVVFKNGTHFCHLESLLSQCYPKGLDLECTGYGTRFQILEATVCLNPEIGCYHFNKNTEGILITGTQNYRRFIPWSSQHPRRILFNVVLGLLHRVWMNTSYPNIRELFIQLLSYRLELQGLGYPARIFKNAAKRMLECDKVRTDRYAPLWRQLLLGVCAVKI
jgi:hypothetical protein